MGGKDFMGSELIFSDTVHQFLQVLTLSRMYVTQKVLDFYGIAIVSRIFQGSFQCVSGSVIGD